MIKKNSTIFRGLFIASLFICFCLSKSIAQPNENKYDNYFSIEVKPSFYQPLKFNQTNGDRAVNSNITIGGSAGIKFTKKITKKISVSFGLYVEEIPHNFKTKLTDSISNHFIGLIENSDLTTVGYKDGQYRYGSKQTTYDQLSYNIEASVQVLLKQIKSNFVFLEFSPKAMYINNSGFGYTYSVGFFSRLEDAATSPSVTLFKLSISDTSTNNKAYRWLPAISTSIGITRFLPKNMLQIKLFLNYVPQLISTGSFSFLELKNENNGTIKHRINNAGFSFSFGIPTKKAK